MKMSKHKQEKKSVSTCLDLAKTPSPFTNVSTLAEKPQHRDRKITKPISLNICYPSQPMGLNYIWETVRTENNEPS
jgi:hypothetical protein